MLLTIKEQGELAGEVMKRQYNYIDETYGSACAQDTSYGFYQDSNEYRVIVSSKVWGIGMLESEATCVSDIEHHMRTQC